MEKEISLGKTKILANCEEHAEQIVFELGKMGYYFSSNRYINSKCIVIEYDNDKQLYTCGSDLWHEAISSHRVITLKEIINTNNKNK